jgi:predicted permease
LVVIEVALSLVLLLGAGLLMRTVIAFQRVELGFDTDHLLLARVTPPRGAYDDQSGKRRFFESALQRLKALPGVVAAAETTSLPPYGGLVGEVDVTGQIHDERWNALLELCSDGYFQTLGVRVVRGQPLSHTDVIDVRRKAIVNEAFVDQYMGQTDPIGRHVTVPILADVSHGSVEDPTFEIVGVTANVKNRGLHESPMPQVFIPYTTTGALDRALLIRTVGDPRMLLTEIQEQLWAVDRNVALGVTATLNDYLKLFSYSGPRFGFIVLGAFATVGLLLVLVGVSSIIAYSVSQRTHEIGIRIAMGATRASLLGMVMRSGLRLLALGVVLGVLGSLGAAQAISQQLWGVAPYDPLTMISVVGVLLVTGIGACYVPARKATLVDPIRTLQAG